MSAYAFYKRILNLFALPKPMPHRQDVDKRDLIARQASGNVSLQSGRFHTREDVDALRKEVLGLNFEA